MQERVRITKRILIRATALSLFVIFGGTAHAATREPYDATITLKDAHPVTYTGIQATGHTDAAKIAWQTTRAGATTTVTPAPLRRRAHTRAAARRRYDVTIALKDGHRVVYTRVQTSGQSAAARIAWQKMRARAATSVTPTPTQPPPPTSPTSTPPPPPSPPPPPPGDQFPNPSTTGTPAGWIPQTVTSSDITVTQPGAVVQDVRLTGGADIIVKANNVTIRRVDLQGGSIDNDIGSCGNALLVEDTTIEPASHNGAVNDQEGVIGYGGYTARRVEILGRSEGLRVSSVGDCGPVTVEDSFVRIVPPTPCGDWHGDGLQGWHGDAVTIRNVTIDARTSGCYGTAPFFYPRNQGNTRATIDGLLVAGQGYSFRDGMPGSVTGLRIVDASWIFGAVDVYCQALSSWEAKVVTIDANYAVTSVVRNQPCMGTGT
jgi:hypothetical protein